MAYSPDASRSRERNDSTFLHQRTVQSLSLTMMAIDADTKLIPSWIIGPRDGVTARIFVSDLASRLADRIQLTSEGLSVYLQAVERAFMEAGVSDHVWSLEEIAGLSS